jgi:DNA-binding NarL/FixJ family response regulator
MPLAIELAAAWVTVLTADQIADRLDDQFALLVSSRRGGIAERHLSLRAAIDWSYDLLRPAEQVVLQRLSVFAGRCWLVTAEAVCMDDGIKSKQMLTVLSSLVDKSLVKAETLRPGDARYSLLETIRQYAAEKLEASGERPVIRNRHLRCFLQLVEETEAKLRGEYQQLWLDWLEDAYDNIRAALSWSLESGQIETGLRMAVALYQFWTIRDYREEGLRWFERLLVQATAGISPVVHINALMYASLMASFAGQIETQVRYAEDAARRGEAAGEESKQALAAALGAQAYAARKTGDLHAAFALVLREIELRRELDDRYNLGLSLSYYSFMAMSLGQHDVARAMLDEGLPLLREAGDPYRIAMALNYRGDLARCEQNYVEAIATYQESINLLRAIDGHRDLASVLHNQGHAYLHLGNVERARSLFRESMAIHQEQQNTLGMAECLLGFAALALAGNATAAGTRLLAAAEAVGGRHVTTEWAATRLEYEAILARARAGLTKNVFLEEQTAGQRLSLEQAVVYALKIADKGAAMQSARQKLDELTLRERDVAALVAQAKSNEEIAQQLVVSKRTVETHVSHILAKLGVTSRAQIVRWAMESGLIQSIEEGTAGVAS